MVKQRCGKEQNHIKFPYNIGTFEHIINPMNLKKKKKKKIFSLGSIKYQEDSFKYIITFILILVGDTKLNHTSEFNNKIIEIKSNRINLFFFCLSLFFDIFFIKITNLEFV